MRRQFIGCVAIIASLAMASVASADTVATNFESFALGTVNLQDGWKSAEPGDVPALPNGYDQAVVNSGVFLNGSTKSLRMSNIYTNGEFHYQTYSKPTVELAGEGAAEHRVFDSSFQFVSPGYQPGLFLSVSPDDGEGGRMSYIGLESQPDGVHLTFYDTPETDGAFVAHDAGVVGHNDVHTIRFYMKLVAGADNDIVRVFVDGRDIGDCLESWENYYRQSAADNFTTKSIDRLEFRSSGTAAPAGTYGYLFDNVNAETNDTAGPVPGRCGEQAAFCSPGYWRNAPPAAWEKVAPVTKDSSFDSASVPDFYANSLGADVSVWDVLTAKGATKYGKAAGPFGLNPFNAVGAALTTKLDGYYFDPAMVGSIAEYCPLDGKGNWKPTLTVSGEQ